MSLLKSIASILAGLLNLIPGILAWFRERKIKKLEGEVQEMRKERQKDRIDAHRREQDLTRDRRVHDQQEANKSKDGDLDFGDWNSGK